LRTGYEAVIFTTMTDDEQMTARFTIAMTPSELQAIDDWGWERRIRSRSEAVRQLIALGIEASQAREGADVDASEADGQVG